MSTGNGYPDYGYNGAFIKSVEYNIFSEKYDFKYDYKNKRINTLALYVSNKIENELMFKYPDQSTIEINATNKVNLKYVFNNNMLKNVYFNEGNNVNQVYDVKYDGGLISELSNTKGSLDVLYHFEYDNNKNLKRIEGKEISVNNPALNDEFAYEFTYDNQKNAYGSTYDEFFSIGSLVLYGFDSFDSSIFPTFRNKNNVKSLKVWGQNQKLYVEVDFEHKYNSEGYPVETKGTYQYIGSQKPDIVTLNYTYY